jgi:hypothetical protein
MEKYGTPQQTQVQGQVRIVTAKPIRSCCQDTLNSLRKVAESQGTSGPVKCPCGNVGEILIDQKK